MDQRLGMYDLNGQNQQANMSVQPSHGQFGHNNRNGHVPPHPPGAVNIEPDMRNLHLNQPPPPGGQAQHSGFGATESMQHHQRPSDQRPTMHASVQNYSHGQYPQGGAQNGDGGPQMGHPNQSFPQSYSGGPAYGSHQGVQMSMRITGQPQETSMENSYGQPGHQGNSGNQFAQAPPPPPPPAGWPQHSQPEQGQVPFPPHGRMAPPGNRIPGPYPGQGGGPEPGTPPGMSNIDPPRVNPRENSTLFPNNPTPQQNRGDRYPGFQNQVGGQAHQPGAYMAMPDAQGQGPHQNQDVNRMSPQIPSPPPLQQPSYPKSAVPETAHQQHSNMQAQNPGYGMHGPPMPQQPGWTGQQPMDLGYTPNPQQSAGQASRGVQRIPGANQGQAFDNSAGQTGFGSSQGNLAQAEGSMYQENGRIHNVLSGGEQRRGADDMRQTLGQPSVESSSEGGALSQGEVNELASKITQNLMQMPKSAQENFLKDVFDKIGHDNVLMAMLEAFGEERVTLAVQAAKHRK